jgi:hypothetical protein
LYLDISILIAYCALRSVDVVGIATLKCT